MDGLEIAHRRLHNQHLAGAPLADPAAAVRHLGAIQAQEYAIAKWSIGQRTHGFDDAGVQRAIDDGAILRTHALRPTWHFVAAADIAWIQSLTGPRVHAANGYYYRTHGMDDAYAARANAVICEALQGGNYLTRKELGEALARSGIEASGNKLAYTVSWAELDGLIANGPMRGKQHTYALVSERVPQTLMLTPEAALAELTRRYFTSHGPATIKDFAWWSSLTVAQIKRGLELVGAELSSVVVDGLTYWHAPSPAPLPPSPAVQVLQGYDEYTVAYTESRPIINLARIPFALPNENTLVHSIMVDGQLAGFWRRRVERTAITVEITPPAKLPATRRRAIEAAFDRYATFAATPVTIRWGPS